MKGGIKKNKKSFLYAYLHICACYNVWFEIVVDLCFQIHHEIFEEFLHPHDVEFRCHSKHCIDSNLRDTPKSLKWIYPTSNSVSYWHLRGNWFL